MSESEAEASFNDAEDAAAQELADSLKKMGKIVNNLMARADCVPFREPVDWKGLQVSERDCSFYCVGVDFRFFRREPIL